MSNELRRALAQIIDASSMRDLHQIYDFVTGPALALSDDERETVAILFRECSYHFVRARRDHAKG
jgi:hypothetical protein